MCKLNDQKEIEVQKRCEKCGNEYPVYQVIKKGKVVSEGYYPNCDCVVEVKLKKWQIPILLGAASLGDIAEGQCSRLTEASEEGLDRYEESIPVINKSFCWRKHVDAIIDQIKNQTGINLEYMESASRDGALDAIFKFVEEEVQRRISEYGGASVNRDWLWRNYSQEIKKLRYKNTFVHNL